MKELLSVSVLLFLVLDPVGNLPLVSAMLKDVEARRRLQIVLRECGIAYLLLLGFMFGGKAALAVMRLSEESLSIAGGVILFMIAIRMVFKTGDDVFGDAHGPSAGREPFIVPLAVPLIAGPSALATVMLLASRDPDKLGLMALALTAVMILTAVILAAGHWIERVIGKRAVEAMERLMGLVLTAIAVEMLLGGIRRFIGTL
jgi:MarC family membrane protein